MNVAELARLTMVVSEHGEALSGFNCLSHTVTVENTVPTLFHAPIGIMKTSASNGFYWLRR